MQPLALESLHHFTTYLWSQIRSLSRLIWINIAVPPADDKSRNLGLSTPTALSAKELRRKKVQLIKLCVCYAFSVKHYLRGEDGLEWEDYIGILPPTVARLAQPQPQSNSRKNSAWSTYAATSNGSEFGSGTASPRGYEDGDERDGEEVLETGVDAVRTDATKRIRPKRSKDKLRPGTSAKSPKTPLLNALHQTIDFNSDPDSLTTPLPLVYVLFCTSLAE